jgi:hypothetical protein
MVLFPEVSEEEAQHHTISALKSAMNDFQKKYMFEVCVPF